MDEGNRREVLSKLGAGAAAFVAASVARAAFADGPGAMARPMPMQPASPPQIRFNRLRALKFANPHGCGPGEFILTTRATRDGLVVAGLSKGATKSNAGFLGQGLHSVHVKVGADNSIELTGLDDILNHNPCPPGSGGGSPPWMSAATVSTVVATGGQPPPPCNACTDAQGNCVACPPPSGGGKY